MHHKSWYHYRTTASINLTIMMESEELCLLLRNICGEKYLKIIFFIIKPCNFMRFISAAPLPCRQRELGAIRCNCTPYLYKLYYNVSEFVSLSKIGHTLITKYAKMGAKCEKQVYKGVFRAIFFVFCAPFFAFRILQHFAPGRHSHEKSKDFVIYFLWH